MILLIICLNRTQKTGIPILSIVLDLNNPGFGCFITFPMMTPKKDESNGDQKEVQSHDTEIKRIVKKYCEFFSSTLAYSIMGEWRERVRPFCV